MGPAGPQVGAKVPERAEAAQQPTPLPAPEKRTPLGAPSTPEAEPNVDTAETAKPAEAKAEDAASKIVKLDQFRKK